jgi:predicted glycoside hydrolase/deacetylase ChbG (UPF0249 family)
VVAVDEDDADENAVESTNATNVNSNNDDDDNNNDDVDVDDGNDNGDEDDNDNDDDDDEDDDEGAQAAKRRTVISRADDDDGPYNQRASKRKAVRSRGSAAAASANDSPLGSPYRGGGGGGGGGKDAADGDVAKGLRHFSLKVCRKVEAKGTTNYAEVADELVAEYKRESEKTGTEISFIDQKNIRRRVYDALNVLRAMNVITKIKKAITWVGLPSADPAPDGRVMPGVTSIAAAAAAASSTRSSAAIAAAAAVAAHNSTAMLAKRLAEARDTREAVLRRIQAKRQQHEELMAQQIWYRNLLSRNMRHANELLQETVERVTLPFIVLNTRADTVIKCQVSPKQTDYFFSFSDPFEIHDDNEILKRMHQRLVLVSATPQAPAQQAAGGGGGRSTFEQQLPSHTASTAMATAPPQFPHFVKAAEQQPTAIDEDESDDDHFLTASQVIGNSATSANSNNTSNSSSNNNSNNNISNAIAVGEKHPQAMSGVEAGNALLAFAKGNKVVSPDGAEAVAALMAASLSPKSQTKQRRLRLNE